MLQLHPSLSFCDLSGRHVFLDLPGDRYFCLDGDLAVSWRAALRGKATPAQAEALLARGLVVASDGRPLAPCSEAIPRRSALDLPAAPASWLRAGACALKTRALRRRLRREALSQVTDAFARLKDGPARDRASETQLAAIAADFARFDILATTLDQCLPRSLAVGFQLARDGYRPDLVFGVRLGPFHAHCWVECDGLLVNDRFERVRDFRPIRRL